MTKKWILAGRSLARRRMFVASVVAMLALGIGANTAIFSLIDAVLLKPLPYPNPDRLVTVFEASPDKNQQVSLIAPVRLEEWNRMNRTFETMAASYTDSVTDTSTEPERLAARAVSPRYFSVFGVRALAGRTFVPEEDLYGGPAVAVISYDFWTRRYHREASAIGRRLILGGKRFTIIGVMPKEFATPATDLWIPAQMDPSIMRYRDARLLSGVGRMKPGITIAQAQQDLERVQHSLAQQFPQTDKDWSAIVGDLKEARVGEFRKALVLVFAAVGLFLLIAVANIAGIMMTQLHGRERELAIRSSIGGTRLQVVGGVMREVLLIATGGVLLGTLAASWLLDLIAVSFYTTLQHSHLRLDWRALSFAAMIGILAAVLCGLLPAILATRASVAPLLARGGRGTSGADHKWQGSLVIGQIALTVLLLAVAGMMIRSYYNLSHVELGFDAVHTITFHISASWDEDRPRIGRMQEELLSKLERFPGVQAAGFTNFLPATGATLRYPITLEGLARADQSGKLTVGERSINSGYLKAMGVPLLTGEDCPDAHAIANGGPKVLVNRRFVESYGQGQNIVGRHLRGLEDPKGPPSEIIGIVGDMREDTLNVTVVPYVYMCMWPGAWPDPEYVVKTRSDLRALVQTIRPTVHSLDPTRAVFGLKTLGDVLEQSLEQPRLNTRMITLFALAAMALASIGLYTVVTLAVTGRTREIGVRMALGANKGQIMRHVFTAVLRLLTIGIAAGLLMILMAGRVVRSVLFGVSSMDIASLAGTILTVTIVSLLATIAPGFRAASTNPLEAIRSE